MKNDYIFALSNSESGAVELYKFHGTEDEMKKELSSLAWEIAVQLECTEEEIQAADGIEYYNNDKTWYIGIKCEADEYSVGITVKMVDTIPER